MDEKDNDKLKGDEPPREETRKEGAGGEEEGEGKWSAEAPPAVDFSAFILSLSASALMHLGEIKNPTTEKVEKDPVMAKHTIEIIGILRDKTKGNLKDDETRLVNNVLHDLRLRYLKVMEETDKSGGKT
jgi:hypothetical protein